MKKKSLMKGYKETEFKKYKKQIVNIAKANKITVKFPLNFLHKQTTQSGFDNKLNCYYLVKAQGTQVMPKLVKKFEGQERIQMQLLEIIRECVILEQKGESLYQFVKEGLIKVLVENIQNSQFEENIFISWEIVNYCGRFVDNHFQMIDDGIINLINQQLPQCIQNEKLNILVRIEDIVYYLYQNQEIQENLKNFKIWSFFEEILKNEKFEKILIFTIKAFIAISNVNDENFKNFSWVSFCQNLSQNHYESLGILQNFLKNFLKEEVLLESSNDLNGENLEFLTLALRDINFQQIAINQSSIVDNLINYLGKIKKTDYPSFLSIIINLGHYDSQIIQKFQTTDLLDNILQFNFSENTNEMNDKIIQVLGLVISQGGQSILDKLSQTKIIEDLMTYYNNLASKIVRFKSQALTEIKIFNSLQFHKNIYHQEILNTCHKINKKDLVSFSLAKEYLQLNSIAKGLMEIFLHIKITNNDYDLKINDDFLETTQSLMKVFKSSQEIHEIIMRTLSCQSFQVNHGKILQKLNFMVNLCNVVWLNSHWDKFYLYTLRFVEKLVENNKIVDILKQGTATIKLVASIKNFLNEEEYKSFYNQSIGIKQNISYAEEQEINEKSIKILEKLLSSTVIDTFKKNISNTINRFKPKSETITILRAEYAVLAIANSINSFGQEGLKRNLQEWLEGNIESIEKAVKRQYFREKDELLGDCIQSLTEYVGITWNEKGLSLYQNKQISLKIFNLLEQYLINSKKPLTSYVMLDKFKNWLTQRIKIIENASSLERAKIYDSKNFMMLDEKIQDEMLVKVMDSLYQTHQKFKDNHKVVKINLEVIILLSYVYPEWKSKTAKNFIPQILEIIADENQDQENHFKALETLNLLCECDESSEQPNQEVLNYAGKKGALMKVAGCVARHNFNELIQKQAMLFFNNFATSDEILKLSYSKIEILISKIEEFNKNPQLKDQDVIDSLGDTVNEINALCLIKPIKNHANNLKLSSVIDECWSLFQKEKNDGSKKIITKIIQNNIIMLEFLNDEENEVYQRIGSDQDIIEKSFQSLKQNQDNQKIVKDLCRLVNHFFPSSKSQKIRKIAQNFKMKNFLEKLQKIHQKDQNVSNEIQQLIINLSEESAQKEVKGKITQIVQQLKKNIKQKNFKNFNTFLIKLSPFLSTQIFDEIFQENGFLDHIIEILKQIHQKTKQKTGHNVQEIVEECLKSSVIPHLSRQKKNLLDQEILLSKNLNDFIKKLTPDLQKQVYSHQEIASLQHVLPVLTQDYEYLDQSLKYLQNDQNIPIMKNKGCIENTLMMYCQYNQDMTLIDNEGTQEIQQSQVPNLQNSTLQMQQSELQKTLKIQKLLSSYDKVMNQMIDEEYQEDIIDKYIKANQNYQADSAESQDELRLRSRQLLGLIGLAKNELKIDSKIELLKKGYVNFLKEVNKEDSSDLKLMKFFDKIFNNFGKLLKNQKIFKEMMELYFVNQNPLLEQNQQIKEINLQMAKPVNEYQKTQDIYVDQILNVKSQKISSKNKDFSSSTKLMINNLMKFKNQKNESQIDNIMAYLMQFKDGRQLMEEIDFLKVLKGLEKGIMEGSNQRILDNLEMIEQIIEQEKNQEIISPQLIKLAKERIEEGDVEDQEMDILLKMIKIGYQVNPNKNTQDIIRLLKNDFQDKITQKPELQQIMTLITSKPQSYQYLAEEKLLKILPNSQKIDQIIKFTQFFKNKENFKNFTKESELSSDQQLNWKEKQFNMLGNLLKNPNFVKEVLKTSKKYDYFKIYQEFKNNDNYPLMAGKCVQIQKNLALSFTREDFDILEDEVDLLIKDIPKQLIKYYEYSGIRTELEELLSLLRQMADKNKPKNVLEKVMKDRKKKKSQRMLKMNEIVEGLEILDSQSLKRPLNEDEIFLSELIQLQIKDNIDQESYMEQIALQDIPLKFRKILNNEHLQESIKEEYLSFSANLLDHPLVLQRIKEDDNFIEKCEQNLNQQIRRVHINGGMVEQELKQIIKLTSNRDDVKKDYNPQKLEKVIKKVMNVDIPNYEVQVMSIKVLRNISKEKPVELVEHLPIIGKKKPLNKGVLSEVLLVASQIILDSQKTDQESEVQEKILSKNFLEDLDEQIIQNGKANVPVKEITNFVNNLVQENAKNHKKIMQSRALPLIAQSFTNPKSNKEVHQDACEVIRKLGYQNPQRKSELVKMGFTKGLVPLFINYSSPQNFDEKMLENVLKCMNNFSLVPDGVKTLLDEGVIGAFKSFLDEYKEELPVHCQIMLHTLANLTYDQSPQVTQQFLDQEGLELILDSLEYFNNVESPQNTLVGLDALTHLGNKKELRDYLDTKQNKTAQILVDILRQRQHQDIIPKTLGCMDKLLISKKLSSQLIRKNIQSICAELYSEEKENERTIYQNTRFLRHLLKGNMGQVENFYFSSLPKEIIQNFNPEHSKDTQKEIIGFLSLMKESGGAMEDIKDQFTQELVEMIRRFPKDKFILKNAVVLLSLCSEDKRACQEINQVDGTELIAEIIDKNQSSDAIVLPALKIAENLILKDQQKQPFLDLKTDEVVQEIYDTTDKEDDQELSEQAKRVLDLLRNEQIKSEDFSEDIEVLMEDLEDFNEEDQSREKIKEPDYQPEETLEDSIPPEVLKYLLQGRIVKVYGDDKKPRTMHFYLSQDMKDLKCKNPKENFVKQKWIIPVHKTKDIKKGYQSNSPIAKSGGFFSKPPKKDICFVVYGPLEYTKYKNFYIRCKNKYEADKWVDNLTIFLKAYRKSKAKNLRSNAILD